MLDPKEFRDRKYVWALGTGPRQSGDINETEAEWDDLQYDVVPLISRLIPQRDNAAKMERCQSAIRPWALIDRKIFC